MPTSHGEDRADALELFADWLSRRESGETSSFEELRRLHPERSAELEELHAAWERLSEAAESDASSVVLHEDRKHGSDSKFGAARLSGLAARNGSYGRYEIEGEIARGGMGAILSVWDDDLRRRLAMKVMLDGTAAPGKGDASRSPVRTIARFLEEAQVTGQLDHPGIVPVHELGLDDHGSLYFTMKLVEGRDLKQIFDLVFEGREGWNETRALGVILKVCEAVAYAHKKGVIHRDLKPANVMVGSFGEVFVMDWGLARVVGRSDTHDLRLSSASGSTTSVVRSDRREDLESDADSPIVTLEGDVVGTPAYMPPEQARGEVETLSARSDVYSIGAMLYHLLARRMPYVAPGAQVHPRAILISVSSGPPQPLHELNRSVPGELVAICEKAMAREAEARYPDTLALAEDLRAYLEHRVVGAYETGALAELRKWIGRNKPLASALAAAVLLLVVGLTASLVFKSRADSRAADLTTANATIQGKNAELTSARNAAEEKANDVLSLSAIQDWKDLEDRADTLWPAEPANLPKYEAWLADARLLIEGRPGDPSSGVKKRPSLADHEAKLAAIRLRAKPLSPDSVEPAGERRTYEFESGEDRWWHAQLSTLVSELKAFQDEKSGGLDSAGISSKHGWGIPRRVEFARTIAERSVDGLEARRRWEEACGAVAASPKYGGLKLEPQIGLLPIGPDPDSQLWEFAQLETGDAPERGADGRLILTESMGIVFVLIPGGRFQMGAQSTDESATNYDPNARSNELPVHEVELSPFFLSKYEMTQGQWERFTGGNPSQYSPVHSSATLRFTLLNPVEQVSWTACMEVMTRMALSLPSEAQWEYACRAGTNTPWWTGADRESLRGKVNLADQAAKRAGARWAEIEQWPDLDDGWPGHAPVGTFAANPFGLHEVHGNVWEWCLDGDDDSFYAKGPRVDPVAIASPQVNHRFRGGSFSNTALHARSANRYDAAVSFQNSSNGLRAARAVRPP